MKHLLKIFLILCLVFTFEGNAQRRTTARQTRSARSASMKYGIAPVNRTRSAATFAPLSVQKAVPFVINKSFNPTTQSTPSATVSSCKNGGYYIENGRCKAKTFYIKLHTKIFSNATIQCVWNDKMLQNGLNGVDGFDDGCSMPVIATWSNEKYDGCRWNDMEGVSTVHFQQRISNFFAGGKTIPENGHTFHLKSQCFPKGSGYAEDYF